LRQNQKCLLIGTPGFRDATLAQLERATRKRSVGGQLLQLGGETSAESMLETLQGIFQEARAAGTAIRVMDNMNWARKKMNFDTLMDYERRVEPLLRRFRGQAMCQYDVRRFPGHQLLRAMKCHPDMSRFPVMLG
jgi:hypothetical protein